MTETLLKIEGLKTHFFTEAGVVKAVDGVSFDVRKGESLGLVGESGSGKTVTALSVLRIVPKPGKIVEGKIIFKGKDLRKKRKRNAVTSGHRNSHNIPRPLFISESSLQRGNAAQRRPLDAHEKMTKEECQKKNP